MKEVDLQTKIVDAVEAHKGAATKLSHKFLIGVVDLIIKLPGYPAALMEVKLDPYPKRFGVARPDVTRLQEEFLLKYARAGMQTGVMSFLHGEIKNYQIKEWGLAIYAAEDIESYHNDGIPVTEYDDFLSKDFDKDVVSLLKDWMEDKK